MKTKIGKRDIVVLVIIFAVVVAVWLGYRLLNQGDASTVRVTVDGNDYGVYRLTDEQEIPIQTGGVVTNTLVIKGGKADMIEATCPDKLCVHQKAISSTGETIVCLPNKVVAEVISSDTEAEFDTIAK